MTMDARRALGITAANEHHPAIFAEWLLRQPEVLDGLQPRVAPIWRWRIARSATRFLFGRGGLSRETFGKWRRALSVDRNERPCCRARALLQPEIRLAAAGLQ